MPPGVELAWNFPPCWGDGPDQDDPLADLPSIDDAAWQHLVSVAHTLHPISILPAHHNKQRLKCLDLPKLSPPAAQTAEEHKTPNNNSDNDNDRNTYQAKDTAENPHATSTGDANHRTCSAAVTRTAGDGKPKVVEPTHPARVNAGTTNTQAAGDVEHPTHVASALHDVTADRASAHAAHNNGQDSPGAGNSKHGNVNAAMPGITGTHYIHKHNQQPVKSHTALHAQVNISGVQAVASSHAPASTLRPVMSTQLLAQWHSIADTTFAQHANNEEQQAMDEDEDDMPIVELLKKQNQQLQQQALQVEKQQATTSALPAVNASTVDTAVDPVGTSMEPQSQPQPAVDFAQQAADHRRVTQDASQQPHNPPTTAFMTAAEQSDRHCQGSSDDEPLLAKPVVTRAASPRKTGMPRLSLAVQLSTLSSGLQVNKPSAVDLLSEEQKALQCKKAQAQAAQQERIGRSPRSQQQQPQPTTNQPAVSLHPVVKGRPAVSKVVKQVMQDMDPRKKRTLQYLNRSHDAPQGAAVADKQQPRWVPTATPLDYGDLYDDQDQQTQTQQQTSTTEVPVVLNSANAEPSATTAQATAQHVQGRIGTQQRHDQLQKQDLTSQSGGQLSFPPQAPQTIPLQHQQPIPTGMAGTPSFTGNSMTAAATAVVPAAVTMTQQKPHKTPAAMRGVKLPANLLQLPSVVSPVQHVMNVQAQPVCKASAPTQLSDHSQSSAAVQQTVQASNTAHAEKQNDVSTGNQQPDITTQAMDAVVGIGSTAGHNDDAEEEDDELLALAAALASGSPASKSTNIDTGDQQTLAADVVLEHQTAGGSKQAAAGKVDAHALQSNQQPSAACINHDNDDDEELLNSLAGLLAGSDTPVELNNATKPATLPPGNGMDVEPRFAGSFLAADPNGHSVSANVQATSSPSSRAAGEGPQPASNPTVAALHDQQDDIHDKTQSMPTELDKDEVAADASHLASVDDHQQVLGAEQDSHPHEQPRKKRKVKGKGPTQKQATHSSQVTSGKEAATVEVGLYADIKQYQKESRKRRRANGEPSSSRPKYEIIEKSHCRFWRLGLCNHGEACRFLHAGEPATTYIPCRDILHGRPCARMEGGLTCRFNHEPGLAHPCKAYIETGACANMNTCQFAHNFKPEQRELLQDYYQYCARKAAERLATQQQQQQQPPQWGLLQHQSATVGSGLVANLLATPELKPATNADNDTSMHVPVCQTVSASQGNAGVEAEEI